MDWASPDLEKQGLKIRTPPELSNQSALIDVNQPSQNKYERKIIVHTNSEYNNLSEEEVYSGVFTTNTHANYIYIFNYG